MKKKLAMGLVLILACSALAGCGGSSDSSEGGEGSGDEKAGILLKRIDFSFK